MEDNRKRKDCEAHENKRSEFRSFSGEMKSFRCVQEGRSIKDNGCCI